MLKKRSIIAGAAQVIIPFDGTNGFIQKLPSNEQQNIHISNDMSQSQNVKPSNYGVDVKLIKVQKTNANE